MLQLGVLEERLIRQAESARFDQLPVIDSTGALCGVIAVGRARVLLDQGAALDSREASLGIHEVRRQLPLLSVLNALADQRAVIFRGDCNDQDDWFALVTTSDLNRHPFRAYLYPIVAQLESILAEMIERKFEDPWTWLTSTSEDSQVRLVGRWELEKRQSVDTSPISGCTMTELIRIVASSKETLRDLGYTSRNKFENATGSFANLRNQIMHPVRPLILGQSDVTKLRNTLVDLFELTKRAESMTASLSIERSETVHYMP